MAITIRCSKCGAFAIAGTTGYQWDKVSPVPTDTDIEILILPHVCADPPIDKCKCSDPEPFTFGIGPVIVPLIGSSFRAGGLTICQSCGKEIERHFPK